MPTPNPEMARTLSRPALEHAIYDVLSRRPGGLPADLRADLRALSESELRTVAERLFETDILLRRP